MLKSLLSTSLKAILPLGRIRYSTGNKCMSSPRIAHTMSSTGVGGPCNPGSKHVAVIMITFASATLIASAVPTAKWLVNNGNEITAELSQPSNLGHNEALPYKVNHNPLISSEEDEMNRNFRVGSFLESILPASEVQPFISQSAPENSQIQSAPGATSSIAQFLSRLFGNVVIDRNSIFRVQFYNTHYETQTSTENESSTTVPNVVFGSPLCWGLCFAGQLYSDNASIKILSEKQFSIIGPPPTPSANGEMKRMEGGSSNSILANETNGTVHSTSNETDIFGWLPSWPFVAPPSIQLLPLQLQETLLSLG